MTGIIRRIEDLAANVASEWTTTHVLPRPVPRFVDQQLRGQLRYGIRVGSFLPNIQPENRTHLVADAQPLSQTLKIDRIVDGMASGCLILIDDAELQLVFDVNPEDTSLQTFNLIKQAHASGSTVDLFAEPYHVVGPVTALPKAALTITQGSETLLLTAVSGGTRGNAISFEMIVPAPSTAFSLSINKLRVAVTLETDSGGSVTTTFQQVIDALNLAATSPIIAELTAGTASNNPAAFGPQNLAGGSESHDIVVRGRFPVLPGDKIWIQSDPALLLSGTDYEVVELFNQHVPSLNLWNSHIRLNLPIPRDLTIDDVVFLRALPGYRSNLLTIPPNNQFPVPLGPFCVDYVSGRLDEGQNISETFSLQKFDTSSVPIGSIVPTTVSKNTPIIEQPIHWSSFLLFKRLRGTILYRDDKLVLRNDERGRCLIWADLVPEWSGTVTWETRATFISPSNNTLIYRFFPADNVIAGNGSLNANSTVTFTLDGTASRLVLATIGPAGGEIELDSWTPISANVDKIQYGVVADVIGNKWRGGSIQIKPYFPTIADLYMRFDQDSFDSGAIFF